MKKFTGKVVNCICVLFSVVFVLLLLSGCTTKANKYGNTDGNSNNFGIATKQGDWIYYSTNTGIYKVKGDDEPEKIYNKSASHLNVSGEWIYFCNDRMIYKMKTDGTGCEKILDNVLYFRFIDGWIYYTDNRGTFRRMLPDKTQDTVVIESGLTYPNVIDGKIYGSGTGMKIIECNLDGTDLKTVYNPRQSTSELVVDGKYIYYLHYTGSPLLDKRYLMKVSLDGKGEPEKIAENTDEVMIYDGWIYYVNSDRYDTIDDGIYKMKTDGTDVQMISDKAKDYYCIVGDWIYYLSSESDDNGMRLRCKMRLDGSDNQILK